MQSLQNEPILSIYEHKLVQNNLKLEKNNYKPVSNQSISVKNNKSIQNKYISVKYNDKSEYNYKQISEMPIFNISVFPLSACACTIM